MKYNVLQTFFKSAESETKLNAHHVQKKIVKLKMDKRPIKHRLSDINRRNVNLNKCITKVVGAPADYTIVSAEGKLHGYILLYTTIIKFLFTRHVIPLSEIADYAKVREKALLFWEHGSPVTPWLDITEEDMILTLPMNVEPLPVGGVQKKPSIVKSGSC
jgi:hypothetical protein